MNQLAARITRLRAEHAAGRATHNALDMDTAADANTDQDELRGIQVYAPTDRRIRGFPCLTHVDLNVAQRPAACDGCVPAPVSRRQGLWQPAGVVVANAVPMPAVRFLARRAGRPRHPGRYAGPRARALARSRRARDALGSDSASTIGPQS